MAPSHRVRPLLLAAGAYLVLSVVVWWDVWSSHPTSTTTCGCGDSSLFTWFLEWPAYAISHGVSPLYSTAMFHPTGVNLLSNTSVVAIGMVLAPVTWLFGPVATLNVALTLSPVLSALAMFVLLRRWVSWMPAAFVGGLLYGFSPVIVVNLIDAHLMVAMAAIPPLVVVCLDELLIRQRRRAVPVGVVLGLLIVVQLFVGTEILTIMVIVGLIGGVLVVGYAAIRHPAELRARACHAAIGLGVATLVAGALLVYPVWFALAGPAHLSGLVWPTLAPGIDGITLSGLVRLNSTATETVLAHRIGGYQGVALHQADFLGTGLIVVAVVGNLVWRRDRRLWLFGTLAAASISLSLTTVAQVNPFWVPWRALSRIPIVRNVLPDRFMAMTFLCVAIVLGVIVDRTHESVGRLVRTAGPRGRPRHRAMWRRALGAGAAVAVAAVALVPMTEVAKGNVPLAARPVTLPRWFEAVAPHLPPRQVVLAYPSTFGGFQSSLTWQAVDRMSFALAEGGGPGGAHLQVGASRAGISALSNATFILDPSTAYAPSTIAAVRHALRSWGVTIVVVPDQPELPPYEQGLHTSYAVGLITAAVGAPPRFVARAWTWRLARDQRPPLRIDAHAFRSCVGTAAFPAGPPPTVPDCMMAAATSQ